MTTATNERLSILIGGKKMYRPIDISRIIFNELKISVKLSGRINATVAFMRRMNYLQPEDYLKIARTAKELFNTGIGGSSEFVHLYTRKAIYKIADYLGKLEYRQNANLYFSDIEFEEIITEKFEFNKMGSTDFISLHGELHFSSDCIGKIFGYSEQLKLFTFTREKLNPFSKVLEFISSIKNTERRIENLIKIHDYISGLALVNKIEYLTRINDCLGEKQITNTTVEQNIENILSIKQPMAAFTEIVQPTPSINLEELKERQKEIPCVPMLKDSQNNECIVLGDGSIKKKRKYTKIAPKWNKLQDDSVMSQMLIQGQPTLIQEIPTATQSEAVKKPNRPIIESLINHEESLQKKVQLVFTDGSSKEFEVSQSSKHSIKMGAILEIEIVDGNKEKSLMFKASDVKEINIC